MYATAPSQQQVKVVSAYRNALGQNCQVVEQNVYIAGQRVHASGTMCRQSDGRWALVH
ncbi:MAG TPA: hypothetical protein VN668_20430 [Stellaceae bacterium]|nr:hypothetical protein [Stellaceae bacterium]